MFTGIIESLGTLAALRSTGGEGRRISVEAGIDLSASRIGDSIAVNGACLTVVALTGNRFSADVSPETMHRTTFGAAHIGDRVNIERAMRLSDRLDGHLVSGHIDGVGVIAERQTQANAWVISIEAPEALTSYMIPKGSVAVDGISLTINHCNSSGFTVVVIPHTAAMTTLVLRRVGERVNLETDMIGKYVARFVRSAAADPLAREAGERPAKSAIDKEFLARKGFI
jgi:riboflavin synthase